MPYLDLADERIYYALHRNHAAGVPVLLIHGAGENHLVWPPGLRRLPGAIVYAVDLPGHGKSAGTGRSTIADYAAWLVSFLEILHVPAAVFIGHSMGGMLAAEVAALDAHRAKRLVLVGAAGFWIDAHTIPDVFALDLSELGGYLWQIAAGARWEGNLHAKHAIVAGHVEGNIIIDEKLEVGFSAVIRGRVRAQSIAIARGAAIEGDVQVTGGAAPVVFSEKRSPG